MILWSTLALAAPGNLTAGGEPYQPNQADYRKVGSGSRMAVELTDDGENTLLSPLVWQGGNECDKDEWGVGDPNTPATAKNLDWCPANDIKDDNPKVPTQLLTHDGRFDLGVGGEWPSDQLHTLLAQPMGGVRDVWQAGHYSVAANDARLPCPVPASDHGTEAINKDEDGNLTVGLDPDAGVVVGWFRIADGKSCAVKYVNKRYTFAEDCRSPGQPGAEVGGELELFSFKRHYDDTCRGPDAALVPYWAVRVTVLGQLPVQEKPVEQGDELCQNGVDDDDDGLRDCLDDGCKDLEVCVEPPGWTPPVWLYPLLFGLLCFALLLVGLGVVFKTGIWAGTGVFRLISDAVDKIKSLWASRSWGPSVAPSDDETKESLDAVMEAVVRRAWGALHPTQRRNLVQIASETPGYLANVQKAVAGRAPLKLFENTSHSRDWHAATESIRISMPATWGDREALIASVALLATLEAEALGHDPATHRHPSTNGVLFCFLRDALAYTGSQLRGDFPSREHPAQLVCRAVVRTVGALGLLDADPAAGSPPVDDARTQAPKGPREDPPVDADEAPARIPDGAPLPIAPTGATASDSTALNAAKAANRQYKAALKNAQGQISELKKDKAALTTERDQARTARANADSDSGTLRTKIGKLTTRVTELNKQVSDYEAQLAGLLGEAEQRRQEEERRNKAKTNNLQRDDSQFLLACIKQTQKYSELKAAVGRIADLASIPALADTLTASEGLLKYAEKSGVRKDYLAAWRALDTTVRQQVQGLQAFAQAAELLRREKDAGKLVQTLITKGGAYSVKDHLGDDPTYWAEGFRAWKTLYRLAQNEQGDNGKALGVTVSHEVFGQVLVPWLQLSQLLGEAIPVELKSAQVGKMAATKRLAVREPAAGLFDKLGYKYEHVELYAAQRTDFQQRRKLVATSSVEAAQVYLDQPPPADVEHDVVVRVQQPLIVDGPRSVRAQIWCLDLEA